jgi:hypothetical protein
VSQRTADTFDGTGFNTLNHLSQKRNATPTNRARIWV